MRVGSEDGIDGFIRRILEKITPHQKRDEDTIAVYRENDILINLTAEALGKTCFETAIGFANTSTEIPLRFAWGNFEEQNNCSQWLRESSRLIVDATSFASIVRLGLWDILREWNKDLIATEATHKQLTVFTDPRLRSEITMLSVPDTEEEDRLAILPLDAVNLLKDEVGQFLRDSDGNISVVGGDALARLRPAPSKDLKKLFDDCTLATIAVAQEQDGVLWIDDRATALVIAEYWPDVKTVNTQGILTRLQKDALLDDNSYYDLLFKMLVSGYTHVLLDENGFRYVIDTTNGNLNDPRLEAVLGLLGNKDVLPLNILGLALHAIKHVWQCKFQEIRSQDLTRHILTKVLSHPNGRGLVQQIVRKVGNMFSPFEILDAKRASSACRIWIGQQVV